MNCTAFNYRTKRKLDLCLYFVKKKILMEIRDASRVPLHEKAFSNIQKEKDPFDESYARQKSLARPISAC
jgi:hypothetical protein